MEDPNVVMIGAGAMGGVIAGALVQAGVRLSIIDADPTHVAAMTDPGLQVDNVGMAQPVPVTAMAASTECGWADLAVIMTPTYETANAALTARQILKPEGVAVSLQNGLGNLEALTAELGVQRVFMGSTKCSADRPAPGRPRLTKLDPTTVGELDGKQSKRSRWLADALTRGGLQTIISDNIKGVLWTKFIHNCAINALSAITGLRMGHVSRIKPLNDLRWRIVEECLEVAAAKGVTLADPDPIPTLKRHTWQKFTKPSMLQHIDQVRLTEIDAINGFLVAEAERLDVDVPINEIVFAMAKGREMAVQFDREDIDYAALTKTAEIEVAEGNTPWDD
ncbi:MAG: ketopantoate reductase family protein [Pseudomonadota bacterium]